MYNQHELTVRDIVKVSTAFNGCLLKHIDPNHFKELDWLEFDRLDELMDFPGVYLLVADGKIEYVGQSINIGRRLKGHHVYTAGRHKILAVRLEEKIQMTSVEAAIIAVCRPPRNKMPGFVEPNVRLTLRMP